MNTAPDTFDLHLSYPPNGEGRLDVRPVVNGRDLLAEIAALDGASVAHYVTTGPRYLLGRHGALLGTEMPYEVRLGAGGCGYERCCGALYVTVSRDGGQIVWSGWRDPENRLPELPEFRFDAARYEAEVRRAGEDRSWEWPGVVVAQLLEPVLRADEDWQARWDCEVEAVWASRQSADRIDLMLWHPRGLGSEGQLQFRVVLPITADDPSEQAERLLARLTTGEPRAGAELCGGSSATAERLGYPWPPDDL